jgi:outer membrane lipoprotein-sorting protein
MALVVIATLTLSAAVAAAAASKIKEYYANHKKKDKNRKI